MIQATERQWQELSALTGVITGAPGPWSSSVFGAVARDTKELEATHTRKTLRFHILNTTPSEKHSA